METADLYDLADQRGYIVFYHDLPLTQSVSLDNGCIGLDIHLQGALEKEHLAHELGHCEYGGFYNRYSRLDIREKSERRANKWAYMKLVPIGELRQAVLDECREPWELAERFGVSCSFMCDIIAFYQNAIATIGT